jgi:catechol 2,3-dioxygenase-like lactoylglutathione lyase family enzyme
MSYIALATDRFDDMVRFYGSALNFPKLEGWDRANGRGQRFDLGGLRLEILDNGRERHPLQIGSSPGDRIHVVIEVDNVLRARSRLHIDTPVPTHTSWGARLFQIRDPDGVAVTFLEWDEDQGNPK